MAGYRQDREVARKEYGAMTEQEAKRVGRILKMDRAEADAAERRQVAGLQVESGEFKNIEDTVVPPTPEWLAKNETIPFCPKPPHWTARSPKTVRKKAEVSALYVLHDRGVLDDQTFAAAMWYRGRYDAADFGPRYGIANYGETVRADPVYGHMPRSEWAALARSDYLWARRFIPADVLDTYEMVVLQDMSIRAASKKSRVRFANASAAFRAGALALHIGIAHRLKLLPEAADEDH